MTETSNSFAAHSPYRRLARVLDALPNRFPSAPDESDLRLLAKMFTPDEADLAADLQPVLEQPAGIAARLGRSPQETAGLLKEMARKGLIAMGKTEQGRLGFGLMPFVVGIYEAQIERIDEEMARLFETYYRSAFGEALREQPQFHRVVPVRESIQNTMEVRPFESASTLIEQAQAWGVTDCICRTQKALIGDACDHPVDLCMVISQKPDAFSSPASAGGAAGGGRGGVRPLTLEEAHQTLRRAAQAGLVHCVSNNQRDTWYICNCCTCSCAVLRGMVDLGIANVVARSSFVSGVDPEACAGCGDCLAACLFDAIRLEETAHVEAARCTGCGLCVPVCPQGALALARRPEESAPPLTEADWRSARRLAGQAG
jgi:NAD-dependent dihydropyrimidine dehydrogenase PreA subunit